MSEEQRKQLQTQLWNIANTLRGKMGADEFRDYILGFIFYKYLSEKVQRFADEQLKQDKLQYVDLTEGRDDEYITALEDACLDAPAFLPPSGNTKVPKQGPAKLPLQGGKLLCAYEMHEVTRQRIKSSFFMPLISCHRLY